MSNVKIPILTVRKGNGLAVTWFRAFELFPVRLVHHQISGRVLRNSYAKFFFYYSQVLLTIVIMWAVCGFLTAIDYFPKGHPARTDSNIEIIEQAAWFRIPYPGKNDLVLFFFLVSLTRHASSNKTFWFLFNQVNGECQRWACPRYSEWWPEFLPAPLSP